MKLEKKDILELGGFLQTFDLWPVGSEWRDELYNYFIKGYPPGSFHEAMLANDLTQAAFKSHIGNKWNDIQMFVKWVYANAPAESFGSYENVEKWLDLSVTQRRRICENKGWMLTEKELAWKILEKG